MGYLTKPYHFGKSAKQTTTEKKVAHRHTIAPIASKKSLKTI